jgi:proteasome lid subunit RPN8/RPN11
MMKPRQIIIPRNLWQFMREQVIREAPFEACGLVAGHGRLAKKIYPVTNMLASPVRFRMEPHEQLAAFDDIEACGLELIAIYHSHPTGPETPSETDMQESHYEVVNLIWSPRDGEWSVRAFWLEKAMAAEIPVEIQD